MGLPQSVLGHPPQELIRVAANRFQLDGEVFEIRVVSFRWQHFLMYGQLVGKFHDPVIHIRVGAEVDGNLASFQPPLFIHFAEYGHHIPRIIAGFNHPFKPR